MPDFSALKQMQSAAWSAGAFEEVAPSIHDAHVALAEALAPTPGESWLDVACGAGHLAELAADAGARVTGIDFSPRLIDVAKERAAAGGFDIAYRVGDAENLDVEDASQDVVSSSVGMIFAPDHDAAAAELARVTRPGGRLGFSAWTPEGTVGAMFKVFGAFQPPLPEGAGAAIQWGQDEHVQAKLGDTFDLTIERRFSYWDDESPEHAWDYFATRFGPVKMMLDNLEPERREQFVQIAKEHFETARQPDGSYRDEREYLLVTGIRKSG